MAQPWDFAAGNTDANGKIPFGGALKGGKGQGIYEESATPQYPIGYLVEFEDGRRFRYGRFDAATTQGLVVSQDVSTSSVPITANVVQAAAAIGATSVAISSTDIWPATQVTWVADDYAGGYLVVSNDTGQGYLYRVKSSTAPAATGAVTFGLYDPLVVAISTTSEVGVVGHKWRHLLVATAASDAIVCGVTVRSMTAKYYGFVQTRGPACVTFDLITNALNQRGLPVFLSVATAGYATTCAALASSVALKASDFATPQLGVLMDVPLADADFCTVDLSIE